MCRNINFKLFLFLDLELEPGPRHTVHANAPPPWSYKIREGITRGKKWRTKSQNVAAL